MVEASETGRFGCAAPYHRPVWRIGQYGAWGGIEVYTGPVIRYAITSGVEGRPRQAMLDDAKRWANAGLEFAQLREKWMGSAELVSLAAAMTGIFRQGGGKTKLLVNGRADVAAAAGADGVHLTTRAGELTVEQVRRVFAAIGRAAVVSVSCPSVAEVRRATTAGADLILFGPVFEKRVGTEIVVAGLGLRALREACEIAEDVPVLALGGVLDAEATSCMEAGAAGVAGIRGFA